MDMNDQLEAILDSVAEGIIAVTPDERVIRCNRAAAAMLGVDIGVALTKKISDVLPIEIAREPGRPKTGLASLNNRSVVVTHSPIVRGEEPAGAVITLRDITEVKRLEARLQSKHQEEGHVAKYSLSDIAGCSKAIRQTMELARRIARSDSTVLIHGESGSGKELFAHAIHLLSNRKNGPFVTVNFTALPETLLESELFGYDEGAFTGARKGGKHGLFEEAHGGTIFLDEIGDASLAIQAKILRVLEDKRIRRIGGTKSIAVDVRVIAATNKDLLALISKGSFREDLYYRLSVLRLSIPPLRERKDDVPFLVDHFLSRLVSRGYSIKISGEALKILIPPYWRPRRRRQTYLTT